MRYWWVNQNQTYKFEVPGGFLWSPKTRADGGRNYFYECMQEVRPGDVVFSFCETYIKAIGIAQRTAITSAKPEFRTAGSNWADEGWLVDVEFEEIDNPIRPKDFMPQIIPLLAEKYAPLQTDGNGLQGVYLTEVSSEFDCDVKDGVLILCESTGFIAAPVCVLELIGLAKPPTAGALELTGLAKPPTDCDPCSDSGSCVLSNSLFTG